MTTPNSISLNGNTVAWKEPGTVADLLRLQGIGQPGSDAVVAVVVDGQLIPRAAHPSTTIAPGAVVSIFSPITGG